MAHLRARSGRTPSRGEGTRLHELRSPSGRVRATIAPAAGACVVSLSIDGREWLHLPEPPAAFLRHDRTGGVPLLFPWANRLRNDRLRILGRSIDLRAAGGVHRDGNGRPMHGVLLRSKALCVHAEEGSATAVLEWDRHRELLRAFPFSLTLRLSWKLLDVREEAPVRGRRTPIAGGMEICTEVEAQDSPVPLSFGWHPYLRLPAPRGRCRVSCGTLFRVVLEDGLPLRRHGALVLGPPQAIDLPLGRASLDDHFAGAADGTVVRVVGSNGARVQVEFVRGYRFAQLYSPRGADFIAIEPMVAPTAALSDLPPELPIIGPGQRASAIYRIMVRP